MKRAGAVVILAGAAMAGAWLWWADWPNPELQTLPWEPDAIVVLGGGNEDRITEGLRMAKEFPEALVVVTGDGGRIVRGLLAGGLDPARLLHEQEATSTAANALRTKTHLGNSHRVVLVTNWFHVPRALRTFEVTQPQREFVVVFKPRGQTMTGWEVFCQRRERMAFFAYFLYWLAVPFLNL